MLTDFPNFNRHAKISELYGQHLQTLKKRLDWENNLTMGDLEYVQNFVGAASWKSGTWKSKKRTEG
jgi:hypothetical protein